MENNAQIRPKFPATAAGIGGGLLIWLAGLIIVRPWGNFPLNDDWSFGRTVQHLIESHDFHPTEWAAMPLLTNTLWGGLFCLPAGFSFDALRVSTLVAAVLGMIGVYALVKMSRAPQWLAVMSALVLGFNPIFFPLSYTFMTDVLFVALCIFASIFLLRNVANGKDRDLFIGTVLVVLSVLSRQFGLAVALAFAIASCLKRGFHVRNLWRALFPVVVATLALIIFQRWMAATGRLPSLFGQKTGELRDALTHPVGTFPNFAYNLYVALLYLGLFLSPLSFCVLPAVWNAQKKKAQIVFAISLWVVLLACFYYGADARMMPLTGNILGVSGVGPVTLRDVFFMRQNNPPYFSAGFWRMVTILSAAGAATLLTLIGLIIWDVVPKLRSSKLTDNQLMSVFLISASAFYFAPILVTTLIDRYLMLPIPLLAAAIVSAFQPLPKISMRILAPATAVLMAFVLFSVCTTRDYLTWNRVRWSVTNDLMANQHVDPLKMEIDGGFEFNGLYFYNSRKDWWEVNRPIYMISFGPLPGYSNIAEREYSQWLPPCTRKVVALKKVEDQVAAKD